MKRMLIVASVAAALAFGKAYGIEVYSENVVGFNKTDVDAGEYVMIASPFYQINGSNSVQTVLGNQLAPGASPALGDNLLFWDGVAQTYIVNWKHPAGWIQGANLSTQDVTQARGFWVKSNTNVNQSVTFAGEVVEDGVITQRVYNGFNMLCYPYNSSINVTNSGLNSIAQAGGNPGTADQIIKWDAAGQTYVVYWKHALGWVQGANLATNLNLVMGEAFWYLRITNTTDWIESVPYSL
jgi:hypothetical protein